MIMPTSPSYTMGILAIVLACFLWGTTGTAASFTPDVSPLATGAFAMGGGGILLLLRCRRSLIRDYPVLRRSQGLLLMGALAVTLYPLCFYSSMRFSGVAIGTVVSIASAPFFVALMEGLISKRRPSTFWFFSFLLGASGIAILALGKSDTMEDHTLADQHELGVLLGLVAGFSYALYSWVARSLIERGTHSGSAMAAIFAGAALLLLPSLVLTGENLFADSIHVSVALYMAVVPMFVGYLAFGYGLRFVAASKATLLTLLEPVMATVMAILIVGERLAMSGWLGLLLIMICLLLQALEKKVGTVTQPGTC